LGRQSASTQGTVIFFEAVFNTSTTVQVKSNPLHYLVAKVTLMEGSSKTVCPHMSSWPCRTSTHTLSDDAACIHAGRLPPTCTCGQTCTWVRAMPLFAVLQRLLLRCSDLSSPESCACGAHKIRSLKISFDSPPLFWLSCPSFPHLIEHQYTPQVIGKTLRCAQTVPPVCAHYRSHPEPPTRKMHSVLCHNDGERGTLRMGA